MLYAAEAESVTIWTIYRQPDNHPDCWVVGAHEVFPGRWMLAHALRVVAATLDEARAKVPPGTSCIGRLPTDHPAIHESWMLEKEEAGRRGH